MKKNRILSFLSAGLLLLGGACTSDVINPNGSNQDDSKVVDPSEGMYLRVAFDLPTAKSTRSFTDGPNSSNSGTEIGHDYENTVKRVLIVLAKANDNSFIGSTLVENENIHGVGTTGRSYQAIGKISKTSLSEYYDSEEFAEDANGNHKINVFVFCNPTEDLTIKLTQEDVPSEWYNLIGNYSEKKTSPGEIENISVTTIGDVIWTRDNFLMSNASIAERLFPSSLDQWDDFSSETTPFNLSGMNNFGRPNQIDNLNDRGNVYVERTAARYDFRDGALDGSGEVDDPNNGFKAQTYHVVLDSLKKPLVDIFLGKMSMVNMNNAYYYLRRVSNNGRSFPTMTNGSDNNLVICGPELPWYSTSTGDGNLTGNYVVDVYSEWKYSGTGEFTHLDFDTHFNYPFFDNSGVMDNVENDRWYTQTISSVLNGERDNTAGWMPEGNHKEYRIWRYLTEGTIPGVNSQKNGVSNGIVFKAQMQPAREANPNDDEFTSALLNELKVVETKPGNAVPENPIYMFANHLYASWDHIRRMALSLSINEIKKDGDKWTFSINRSTAIYNAVFGTGGFGSVSISIDGDGNVNFMTTSGNVTLEDEPLEDQSSPNYLHNLWNHQTSEGNPNPYETEAFFRFRDAVVKNNITVYQESYDADLGGYAYYCYYFYWNRHNDNGQNGVMGEMEFDVVRNNVYKLAVTKIARLGHPRVPANDPDKPTPNTPDEKADVYLTVTCTTLPWVVRENNIEF